MWKPRASQRVNFEEARSMHGGRRETPYVARKDKAKRKVAGGGLTVQSDIKDVPKKGYCSGWVKSKVVGPGDGEGARESTIVSQSYGGG